MNHYLCTNCGFWQTHFETPPTCPVCTDFRHTPPDDGWEFLTEFEAAGRYQTRWHEDELGIVTFTVEPKLGIGPSGYFIPREDGNIGFECPGFYDKDALDYIESRGGLAHLSFSHPHAFGAAWQLQERFQPQVSVQVEDLNWSGTLNVDYPFDESLELAAGARLVHTAGHFAGHSVLHLYGEQKILFAGDMLKFHFDEDERFVGISTHKAFNRRVPMSHAEVRRYDEVVRSLGFDHVYTTFERAPANARALALRLFDAQLAGAPFFGPLEVTSAT